MNAIAMAGHNKPPAHINYASALEDLKVEAESWLDGAKIENDSQASAVATLIAMARDIEKGADETRKAEAKPFDDGKAAVQARWRPIIDGAKRIATVAKNLQGAWLIELDRRQREAAARAEAEARAAREAAEQAAAAANPASLADQEQVEDARDDARRAEAEARRAANATAKAKGSHGRAVALRTYRIAEVENFREAAAHYYKTRRADLEQWVLQQAQADVRAGATSIPGIAIREEKRAA